MRKFITFTLFMALMAAAAFAQKRPAPVRTAPPRINAQPPAAVTEISAADWQALADALVREDWTRAAAYAAVHLKTLKTDNDRKQLAQLRYLYLFALAGKILAANAQGNAAEAEKNWNELDRVMEKFIGQEFVLPPRPFAVDCSKRLNYVCAVKSNPKALRTTATNKEGNGIHSFDYVLFDEAIDLKADNDREVFLGGTLQRADYNEDKSKPWVVRLFFNNGFARINGK